MLESIVGKDFLPRGSGNQGQYMVLALLVHCNFYSQKLRK